MTCDNLETIFCDTSIVSRGIKDKRHLKDKQCTPDAFIYPESSKALSLVHIDDLDEPDIWYICDNEVFKNLKLSSKAKFKTIARADMNVNDLKCLPIDGFQISRDDDGFERHVTALSSMEKQLFAVELSLHCIIKIR